MIPIPEVTNIDLAFGNADHMPKYQTLPDSFKKYSGNKYNDFISAWFFIGITSQDMKKLQAKRGVDRTKALAALKAILASWEPKHQHKISGCGYLLSEWFDLGDENE